MFDWGAATSGDTVTPRLMFERDLTPHPHMLPFINGCSMAFKLMRWFTLGCTAQLNGCLISLGNTSYSWSDILLGNLPNLYIYAANNPSNRFSAAGVC